MVNFSLFVYLGCELLDLFVGNVDWAQYFVHKHIADKLAGDERAYDEHA